MAFSLGIRRIAPIAYRSGMNESNPRAIARKRRADSAVSAGAWRAELLSLIEVAGLGVLSLFPKSHNRNLGGGIASAHVSHIWTACVL
jgi:hypothetical protein